VADAAAKRKSRHPSVTEGAARRCELVALTRRIKILPQRATTTDDRRCIRIDAYLTHQPEIDNDAAVTNTETGDAMTAAPHRHRKSRLACELDGGNHILNVKRSRYERWTAVEHSVESRPRDVIAQILGRDERASMPQPKLTQRRCRRQHEGS
jgi:hypothetical protein